MKRHTKSIACISLLLAIKPNLATASDIITTQTTTASTYQLSRILFLRLLAIVYTAAFSVAKFQNKGLIGDNGILPARNVLNDAESRGIGKEWLEESKAYQSKFSFIDKCKNYFMTYKPIEDFWHRTDRMNRPLPTLLWFARDRNQLNPWLDGLANVGLFLSSMMLMTGSSNVLLIAGLYIIQRSFMSVGAEFYGYGWEPQLAELTFHTLFFVPLLSMNPFFESVPKLVIWSIRFYLFKIMMGAGLIKAKSSDVKWKPGNLSAMEYHYETQPVPNGLSKYFHKAPKAWHHFEVWMNHFVELLAPFLLLMPWRNCFIVGGLIQMIFQITLILSGNLSFLNWLTMVPAILCLDDGFLINNLPTILQKVMLGTPSTQSYIQSFKIGATSLGQESIMRTLVSIAFFLTMAKLNMPVVRNLLAKRQIMNGSFDRLRLAGTYGAFGVVSEQREELIFESANDVKGPWKEYHFKVKPGDIYRKPRWISPYHYRLDWQIWIAAVSGRIERSPWLIKLLIKLLNREKDVVDLLESDPWATETSGPKYIRIEKYQYKYYDHRRDANDDTRQDLPPFWKRERRYFPRQGVLTKDILEDIVNAS